MKFNKNTVKKAGSNAVPVAEIMLGFVVAKVIPWAIGKLTKKPVAKNIAAGAEIVGGLLLSTSTNKHVANVGLGVAASGAHSLGAEVIDKALDSAGIKTSGIAGTNWRNYYYQNPGISGSNNGINCPQKQILN
ncbi:MAG: hypothetical protein HOP11_09510 [Saprospiraceae bacterium]|nr:hypothetical protein [Saprospiraceae bacterium]